MPVRALVQRVSSASVSVTEEEVGRIGPGLCVFVGVTHTDSARELGREILVVSQFTLYADTSKGRRPSFVGAAPADTAEPLIQGLILQLRALGARVAEGRFGGAMQVALVNDGPFTVLLEL
jgi:D-tyrosyl-tRNA(Tyr) deacylase